MTEREFRKKLKTKKMQITRLEKNIKLLKKKNKLLKKQKEYYKKIACTDSLTHLGNRRSLEKANDYDTVILGDIDHFKKINDKYGHDLGDLVLVEVSKILKKFVRESDLACRWGGEEFVILLKNCNDKDAYNKAMQLKEQIALLGDKFGFEITMSFGISNILNKTLSAAIDEADKAMYKSKEDGRDRVTIYSLTL